MYFVRIEADAEDMQKGRYLIFGIGNVMLGIEMRYITEIIVIEKLTETATVFKTKKTDRHMLGGSTSLLQEPLERRLL